MAEDLPLDAAVAGARTSLKAEVGSTLEWGDTGLVYALARRAYIRLFGSLRHLSSRFRLL